MTCPASQFPQLGVAFQSLWFDLVYLETFGFTSCYLRDGDFGVFGRAYLQQLLCLAIQHRHFVLLLLGIDY